ncbi:serine hydrolase domain-containing protein [Adhaeribacter aquaticus]|uniref:serine hydrolase domain-containing protein n=1 Tax=Adhaeribacter aquaticus TaxID=299567 RepID=UPI0003F86F21|nr:serine hydrolase domain-containing protein [Adhaeribacter aquaticus]
MNNRFLFLLFLLISFVFVVPSWGQVIPNLDGFDEEITAFIEGWQLPGASVALVKNGQLIYSKGYGQADEDTPTQPQNLYRIASVSKPITAIAIFKLKEQGKLSLDSKVFGLKGILPIAEYPFTDQRINNITIRQLLQHTAGWDRAHSPEGDPMFNSVHIAQTMGVPAPANAETIIRYMLTKRLDFKPGRRHAYSNFGYCILGRVIEKLSGVSYEEYVQTHVLQPIGIKDMHLASNYYDLKKPNEVRYFDTNDNTHVPAFDNLDKFVPGPYGGFNIEAMDAHGGWLASAADLAKLLAALDENTFGPTILSADSLRELGLPSKANKSYANGWMVNGSGAMWHTGSLPGTSSLVAKLPNGLAWVVLVNGKPNPRQYFNDLDKVMWRATAKIYDWPTHDLFKAPTMVAGSSSTEEAEPFNMALPAEEIKSIQ